MYQSLAEKCQWVRNIRRRLTCGVTRVAVMYLGLTASRTQYRHFFEKFLTTLRYFWCPTKRCTTSVALLLWLNYWKAHFRTDFIGPIEALHCPSWSLDLTPINVCFLSYVNWRTFIAAPTAVNMKQHIRELRHSVSPDATSSVQRPFKLK